MFKTLRAQIVLVMIVTAIINVGISFTLFFIVTYSMISNNYIPILLHRYSNIVSEHYADGKSDVTLHTSIEAVEDKYGPFIYSSITITKPDGRILYPYLRYNEVIDVNQLEQRYTLYLPDHLFVYIIPSLKYTDYPPLRGFASYTINSLQLLLVTHIITSGLIGVVLMFRIYRPIDQLVNLLRKRQSDTSFVTQLTDAAPNETLVLAHAIDDRDQEIRQQIHLHRQLIADVAHELRNPLNTINGYVEAMRDGELEPTVKRLTIVHDEIQSLHRLINDMHLLSLAEVKQISLSPVVADATALANHVYQLMLPLCQSNQITFTCACASHPIEVWLDTGRITQVLINLIDNSIRHTPAGGTITLTMRTTNQHVIFVVSDTGDGIAAEDIPRIFDRFYRGKFAQGHGTGLGLAIAKAFVEAHNGNIDLQSVLTQGTTVTIHLPHTTATTD